ncbi:SH3 domain-containing protein [Bacillus sp. CGMCC 1.16607]|uniref:SH3 domain-containing protein n=1 Tax=Bacillus sp. CGMCC 1.16607 TaxID=3351842 RepID=UPI003628A794
MKKFIILVFVTLLFFGGIPINSFTAATETSVTITINGLNVREGPGLSYRVVKQVKKGESFPLVKEENEWIQIKLNNNQFGWVANWLVQKQNKQITVAPQKENSVGLITVDGLRVRNGPGTNFQTIGHVNKGNQVTIKEKNENWIKVSANSLEGWISSDFVTITGGQATDKTAEKPTKNIKTATIQVDSLNVRSEASLQSNVIGKLKKGDKIEVISSTQDWIQIYFQNQKAWISSEFVKMNSQSTANETKIEEPAKPLGGIVGTITANALNIRSQPDLGGKIVGSVSKGNSYSIIEEVNNWSKIEFSPKQYGWVNTWYLEKAMPKSNEIQSQEVKESIVTILHDGTNIRSGPNVSTSVILRSNEGEQFQVKGLKGDWYEIQLKDGVSGYIAGWLVSVSGSAPQVEKPGAEAHLKNKTIILDPGHGGGDNGTTGSRGTLEKELTLRTANLLYDKLRASGANVILTRTNDSYFSLRSRVSTAQYHNADAFISIHYDSILDKSVRGLTTYYYHSYQKPLAETVHASTIGETKMKDRSARFGDYHVLRENSQKAVLIELGYLSNPAEETTVTSAQYQETAATGIFNGLAKYFKTNL